MKVRNAVCIGAAVVLAWGVMATQASTALPYAQSFEAAFPPDAHWAAGGGGLVASVAPALLPGSTGASGLSCSNDTVTLEVDNATYNNVWIQVYAKPVVGASDPSSVSGQTGAFYVRSDGALRACTNAALNSWVTVATGLPTTTYLGFIVHADYATGRWEIYYSTGNFQTNRMQLASLVSNGRLHFATSGAQIDNVSVSSGDKTYLDTLAVARGFTTAGTTGDRVATYEHSATSVGLQDFTLPAYAAAYTNPAANSAVGSFLGNAILSGLVNGDSLQVWNSANGVFETYDVTAGAFDALSTPNAINKSAMFVSPNTRLLLDPNNARSQTFGFYGYSNATVQAFSGISQPPAQNQQSQVTLNGTAANVTGFTALNWVDDDNLASIVIDDPLAQLDDGDRLFVAGPSAPNSFTEYWYDNGVGRWRNFNNQLVSSAISAGSKIWVKRQQAGNSTITVTH